VKQWPSAVVAQTTTSVSLPYPLFADERWGYATQWSTTGAISATSLRHSPNVSQTQFSFSPERIQKADGVHGGERRHRSSGSPDHHPTRMYSGITVYQLGQALDPHQRETEPPNPARSPAAPSKMDNNESAASARVASYRHPEVPSFQPFEPLLNKKAKV
jgi:hypothetical protein